METEIAADLPLDYVKFHLFTQDSYEACICNNGIEEMVGDGSIDDILEHLPNIKGQLVEGCDNFKLELQGNHDDRSWFIKATLTRFFQLVSSSDLLKKPLAISKEMYQLEETRKFHLSLYAKAEDGIKSSDNSKNELMRAMESRLAALTEELVSTFNLAAGTTLSLQEMVNMQKFCQQFGDVDMSNMFSKLFEANKKSVPRAAVEKKNSPVQFISKDEFVKKASGNIQASGPSDSNKPIKYNASPAKAAEIERQSSSETESEEDSSFSSEDEDDQPSSGRSRTLTRPVTPRRSASPMRRIQIGRSGSRRTPALTIKSLTHFPARVKLEESEEPIKKTEVNVTRMSVQDAISLFERKQNDEKSDTQKKLLVDNNNSNNNNNHNSTNVNKTVLRRWSAGMGESRNVLAQYVPEDSGNLVYEDALESKVEEPNEDCGSESVELEIERTLKVDMESEANENNALNRDQDDVAISQVEENNEKLDSAEWSRQKEVELNQMLMKFAEYNQINLKNAKSDNNRRKSSSLVERNSGIISQPKEKRDEKISALKRVVKPAETKLKPRIQEKPMAEKSPLKVSVVAKKDTTTSKIQNLRKSSMHVVSNSKKESPKPVIPKKAPLKSTPSPRTTGTLPSKIPALTPPSRNTVPRQKPQSPASLSKPTPKLEKSNLLQKDTKKPPVDSRKILKKVDDSKSPVVPKREKTAKATAPKEEPNISPAKPAVRKKVTKRSSVVPLEAKAEERKVSGIRPTSKPLARKIEKPTQQEEILSKCEKHIDSQEKVEAPTSDPAAYVVEVKEDVIAGDDHLSVENPKERENPETKVSDEAPAESDEVAERRSEIEPTEEQVISPAAWVESNEQESCIPNGHSSSSPSPANRDAEASSEIRVRHSLHQMLLEETSEPDVIEWGNAENPPTMVSQKDAPKGLKRLLKFARKNKGESNAALWSSPYASDGEDDGEEIKSFGKRNSDNLLKVALHSKNYGEGFLSDSDPLSARSNVSNSSARSSRGPRSFFLSAFRGQKN